jgi:hypothetical protein
LLFVLSFLLFLFLFFNFFLQPFWGKLPLILFLVMAFPKYRPI